MLGYGTCCAVRQKGREDGKRAGGSGGQNSTAIPERHLVNVDRRPTFLHSNLSSGCRWQQHPLVCGGNRLADADTTINIVAGLPVTSFRHQAGSALAPGRNCTFTCRTQAHYLARRYPRVTLKAYCRGRSYLAVLTSTPSSSPLFRRPRIAKNSGPRALAWDGVDPVHPLSGTHAHTAHTTGSVPAGSYTAICLLVVRSGPACGAGALRWPLRVGP